VVLLGAEGLQLVVEVDLAAVVAPQVKGRIPAAGHGDEIRRDLRLLDDAALALAVGATSPHVKRAFDRRNNGTWKRRCLLRALDQITSGGRASPPPAH
jgi:hypothetical protein